jgi:hypothetical protein
MSVNAKENPLLVIYQKLTSVSFVTAKRQLDSSDKLDFFQEPFREIFFN